MQYCEYVYACIYYVIANGYQVCRNLEISGKLVESMRLLERDSALMGNSIVDHPTKAKSDTFLKPT